MLNIEIICEEDKLPRNAPRVVHDAIDNGQKVEFRPKVFKESDNCPCGSCYTIYMPGWYEVHLDSRILLCDIKGNLATENRCGIIGSKDGIYNV